MGQGLLTREFVRTGDTFHCEGVSLARIAQAVGTPVYVYSVAAIRDRYERLAATLASVPHRIHYTLKANSNAAILREVRDLGAAADVVSGGELHRALAAGFTPGDIIFGGVGKTARELREAVAADIQLVSAESEAEVRLLSQVAVDLQRTARVSLRVNPEITLEAAHDYIKTGERGHKFGIPYDDVVHVGRVASKLPNLELVGLGMHLGSQLSRIDPYRSGVDRLLELHAELVSTDVRSIRYLDIGGGLGVRYDTEAPPDLERFADLVLPPVRESGLQLIMEPGRFIVGNAGVLVTEVLYRKHSGGKDHVIVDAGMTELLRPSHYGAFHRIEPVRKMAGRRAIHGDVVGPVCESGDFLALDRRMDDLQPGDLLTVFDTGAYGYAMASNYNSRPRPAEVLVDGDRFAVVTERETYSDLMHREVDHPTWRS